MPRHKIHRVIGTPRHFRTRCGKEVGTMRDPQTRELVPDGQMLSVRTDMEMRNVHPDYRCSACERSWDAETAEIVLDAATPPPLVR